VKFCRAAGIASCIAAVVACSSASGPRDYPLAQIGLVLSIAPGPDGAMWFTLTKSKAVGSISSSGSIQMYQNPPNIDAEPQRIAAGADGAMWFTQVNPHEPVDSGPDMIGRITMQGTWVEFPIPSWDALPQGIAAGSDGAMWFAERRANAIGRITMKGKIAEYPLPHGGSGPTGIVRGQNGRIWFTETDGNRIGCIDPSSKAIAEFAVPVPKSKPGPIAALPGGDLYFIELAADRVARITASGTIRQLPAMAVKPMQLVDIAAGKDSVWIADLAGNKIWRYFLPSGNQIWKRADDREPLAVAAAADGTIWYSERKGPSFSYTGTGGIGRL
jgi:virginiamycin B lyase